MEENGHRDEEAILAENPAAGPPARVPGEVVASTVTRRIHLAYSVGVLSVEDAIPDTKVEPAADEGPLLALIFTSPDGTERDVFIVADPQRAALLRGLALTEVAQTMPGPPNGSRR